MATFIKAGLWTKKKEGYKGELNLDQLIESTIPSSKYKVFTALLTQSGVSNVEEIFSGNLTIGVSYMIGVSHPGDDFTNVGGPLITSEDEYVNTYFVATGTIPNNWNNNTGLEYNTGTPIATVLENTIGNTWFTYLNDGYYGINSDNLFSERTGLLLEPLSTINGNGYTQIESKNNSTLTITPLDIVEGPMNGLLINTMIEIRVYN